MEQKIGLMNVGLRKMLLNALPLSAGMKAWGVNNMNWLLKFTATSVLLTVSILPASAQELVWEETNGLSGKDVRTILTTPDGTLFAGTAEGGIYRSDDKGKNWTEVSKGLNIKGGVNSLTVMGKTIFAATDGGIYRSDDMGNNWNMVSNFEGSSLAVIGTTIFSTSIFDDIYASRDMGEHWFPAAVNFLHVNFRSLAVMGTTIFVGGGGGAIYRLDSNAGDEQVDRDIIKGPVNSLAVMGTTVFAGIGGEFSNQSGVYRSDNMGNNWVEVSKGLKSICAVRALAVMGTTIFAGIEEQPCYKNGSVYRSDDMGNNWVEVNTGLRGFIVNTLAVMGANIYAGTEGGGIFRASLTGKNAVTVARKDKLFTSWGKIKSEYFLP